MPDAFAKGFAPDDDFVVGFSTFLPVGLLETDFDVGFPAGFAVGFAGLDGGLLADFEAVGGVLPDFADNDPLAEAVFTVFDRSFSDFDLLLEAFFLSGLAI